MTNKASAQTTMKIVSALATLTSLFFNPTKTQPKSSEKYSSIDLDGYGHGPSNPVRIPVETELQKAVAEAENGTGAKPERQQQARFIK